MNATEKTYESKVADAKARLGLTGQVVYTVVGEHGNSDGAYTAELPSMAAALEAIRTDDLPYCPRSEDGGLKVDGSRVSFTVRNSLCYTIVEHEPATQADKVTGWTFGGIHSFPRRAFRLADGTAVIAGEQPIAVPESQLPAEWIDYRRKLAAIPPRTNSSGVYRDVLGVNV